MTTERAPRREPVEALDLVDVDGDRIRFRLHTGRTTEPVEVWTAPPDDEEFGDWDTRAALTLVQASQVRDWLTHVIGDAPVGRPYTDEELARGPLTDQAKQFITGNLEGDRG
jgi:hypothetical protein